MNLDKGNTATRTIRATEPGPARIKTKMTGLGLTVIVNPKAEYGELTVAASVNEGPVADRVRDADLRVSGNTLSADLQTKGGGGVTIVQGWRGNSVSISGGSGVIVGNGTVMVNGQLVSGGRGGAVHIDENGNVTTGPAGTVTVTATVPPGSTVDFNTTGGSLTTSGGQLAEVEADTSGGNINVESAEIVEATTSGGNITVSHVATRARLRTSGGNITVNGSDGAKVRARTSGGNIRHGDNLDCDATTAVGRVIPLPTANPYRSPSSSAPRTNPPRSTGAGWAAPRSSGGYSSGGRSSRSSSWFDDLGDAIGGMFD